MKHHGRLPFLAEAEVQKSAELPSILPYSSSCEPPIYPVSDFLPSDIAVNKSSFSLCVFYSLPSTPYLCFPSTNSPGRDFPFTGICSTHLCLLRQLTAGLSLHQGDILVSPGLDDRSNGTLCKLPFRKVGGLEESKPQEERVRKKHFSEGQNM